jgi:beta-lactamase regulating signal transducer with metallopeptidase domain
MTPSYLSRLLLLSSASFFVVLILAAAVMAWIAPAAIRRVATVGPRRAAQWLLTLRLLPAALSAMAVAGLCVPSYLRFEPHISNEEAGVVALTAAILGAAICVLAIYRASSAMLRSALYLRRSSRESVVNGEKLWIVRDGAGLALAGILRPRLLISEGAVAGLSSDELAVALRHEHSHRDSRDNLRRLLIQLAPAVFPGLRKLEQAWVQCAEWAADDWATEGDRERSAALASALVRIARLQSNTLQSNRAIPALVTSLVAVDEDLKQRVDRLLDTRAFAKPPNRGFEAIAFACVALLIGGLAMNLRLVHVLLENLLD